MSDSHLLPLLTDLRLLLTFKRPCCISPFPYTFLYTFQLHGDTQLIFISQQTLCNAELEVGQQDAELANHFADVFLTYFLTFFCDREMTDDILSRSFHLYRRTFDTFYLWHSLNGGV